MSAPELEQPSACSKRSPQQREQLLQRLCRAAPPPREPRGRAWGPILRTILLMLLLFAGAGVVGAAPMMVGQSAAGPLLVTQLGLAGVAAAAPSMPAGLLVGGAVCTVMQEFSPEGVVEPALDVRCVKVPEHRWLYCQLCQRDDVAPEQMEAFRAKLKEMRHCFAHEQGELVGYKGSDGAFRIDMDPDYDKKPAASRCKLPLYSAARRYPQLEVDIINDKCSKLEAAGIIESCLYSDYAACPALPAKKDAITGEWTDKRMAIDYRACNAQQLTDHYGLHNADDLMQKVRYCEFISKMDMYAGFHQIPIEEQHRSRTAFWWSNRLMQFKRMQFGLKNATAKFQRCVDKAFREAGLEAFACAFVDDVMVYTRTFEEHCRAVPLVLEALHANGLFAHPASDAIITRDLVEPQLRRQWLPNVLQEKCSFEGDNASAG